MFTGIIQEVGSVKEIRVDDSYYITISCQKTLENIKIGSSICSDGICLTVLEFDESSFTVQVMPETINKTNLSEKKVGDKINLEPSLKVGDPLDGHIVSGHIDGVGIVEKVESSSDNWVLTIKPPTELMTYIAQKGSITLNGVSLTVSNVEKDLFSVSLIKHTLENTNLGSLRVGDKVNVEVDTFARYVEKFINR